MKHGLGLSILLTICSASGAEPPPAAPAGTSGPEKAPSKPLDLRVGDVRKYMMPKDYQAAIHAPPADRDTVVVEAKRELLPFKPTEPVPGGLFAPFWMLANPSQAWRALMPDVNAPPAGPPDVVPKREFRWGP